MSGNTEINGIPDGRRRDIGFDMAFAYLLIIGGRAALSSVVTERRKGPESIAK
ncbi:hypothetical protein ACIREM_06795 [Streptomyces shenzhenensis]|uniref:hypothetical protein n=1 Tax=Streptomyces shenzhenensis TaxID=943815 RepID=UPI003802E878